MQSDRRRRGRRPPQPPAAHALEPRTLLSASLVTDLNPAPFYGDIDELAAINGKAIFATHESATGEELYVSDGSAAGTSLLKDINPGLADSAPKYLTVSGAKVYFSADDGAHGRELWETDGTAPGTQMVSDLAPGGGSSDPVDLTDVNGTLFFVGNGPGGTGLYKTDGTAAGTVLVKGSGIVAPLHSYLTNVNGTVFFRGYDPDHGYELWKSDGTSAGTQMVSDVTPGPASSDFGRVANVNGTVYFDIGTTLYKSDGTASGTSAVEAIPNATSIQDLTSYNGLVVFHVADSTGDEALWRSDGTPAGTFVLHETGALTPQQPGNIAVSHGALYFGVYTDSADASVWSTDGTTAGTTQVMAFTNAASAVQSLTDMAGTLYFTGDSGSLWKTDGSAAGTVELGGSNVRQITPAGSLVFFRSSTGIPALSVSDGTAAGTVMLKQFQASTQGSEIEELTAVGDKVFFTASNWAFQGGNPFTPYELYVTDGTQAGTTALAPLTRYIQDPLALGGKFYFLTSRSLSVSDGTSQGTVPVETFPVTSAPPLSLTTFGGKLFFGENGLWVSDGTPAGTMQIESDVDARLIAAAGDQLFFIALDSQTHYSLWKTDGTSAGTVKLSDLPNGNPTSMTAVGNRMYFVMSNSSADELWTSDGTAGGTAMVRSFHADFDHSSVGVDNLVAMNGLLYFHADDGGNEGLWSSDGTAAGTTLIDAFAPANPTAVSQLTVLGNHLFFAAYPPAQLNASIPNRWILWESDGTAAGTMPFPGLSVDAMADVRWITTAGGKLFFENYADRLTLWSSDGTPAGTQVVAAAQYMAETAGTPPVTVANGSVFFESTNGADGESLYTIPLDYSGPVAQIAPPAGQQLGGVNALTITFNRPVTGLTVYNLSLKRADGPNLLSADQTLTTPDAGKTWTLRNLAGITALAGNYVLTLHANDWLPGDPAFSIGGPDYPISDASGNPLMTGVERRFSVIAPASISGNIFNDINFNGIADASEPGLAGWTVYIDANGNGTLDLGELTATTDADGKYRFADLAPGSYVVRQVAPAGWRLTTQPGSAVIPLTAGQSAGGPVFGDVRISTVPMDFTYLLTLAQHYGQSGTFAQGDVNGDGQVGFSDLLLIAQNYGHTLPAATAADAPATQTLSASTLLKIHSKSKRAAPRPV